MEELLKASLEVPGSCANPTSETGPAKMSRYESRQAKKILLKIHSAMMRRREGTPDFYYLSRLLKGKAATKTGLQNRV
jgi:hypothetical protein